MISTEYSPPQINVISANTISEKRREEKRVEAISKFLSVGVGSAAFGIGVHYSLKNSSVNSFFNSSIMDSTIKETVNGRSWDSLFSDNRATLGKTLLEGVRKVEELSPFRIFRTLQLSHLLTPYSTGRDAAIDISPDLIRSQEKYFSSLLKNRGETNLSQKHLRYGLRLEDGRLFEKNASGEIGDIVAKEARLMFPYFALPKDGDNKELVYANKILKQYSTHIGAGETDVFNKLTHSNTDPFIVIAARSKSEMNFDLSISYFRNVFAQGAKILDRPFDFILEYLPTEEGSDWHNRFKKWSYVGAGTGGKYRGPISKSLQLIVANNIKLLSAASSYYAINHVIKEIAPNDSSFSDGLLKGLATTAVNTHLAFSEMWSDNFQEYKEAQEFYATDSTSIMTMAGAPLAIGTAGATASYMTRLYDNARFGIEQSEINAEAVSEVFPERIKNILPKKIGKIKGSRSKRWGILGFSAGLILEAPFIPGALIGEDSETLRRQYSGEEDVAIRKNRWWFSSSNKYGGDSIKYFDKSAYSRLMADTDSISKYGDIATEELLNPILHPFDYLRDPYQFEKMNSESRPYPVWGMDISTGSFIGKFFEKTIGAIIKPDVINPRLAEELADLPQGAISREGEIATGRSIASAIDSGIFAIKTDVSEGDASLIEEGKLIAPAAATYEPIAEAASWSWEAFKDFVGLKGWIFGEMEEAMDIPSKQVAPQLARSGEITNAAKSVRDMNLGGLWGLTEPQRRYIPTSASVTYDRVNPLKNNMPTWMPGSDDSYFIDFQKGDPYGKIEHGASRLPGRGFESLNKEMEGIDPEDYPDIFKMKILSDVAMGSSSYYSVKNSIEKREEDGTLTSYEYSMLGGIRKKEFLKSEKRQFSEYKGDDELEGSSLLQLAASKYWETGSHGLEKSLPSEFLTFFRPAGKLIHQRSSIEDYERTQFEGSDMAIWTKPIGHFIKPALVSARRIIDTEFESDEVKERRQIDRYFDTLEYVKQRRIYKDANKSGDSDSAMKARVAFQKTTEGALASGIDTDQEILRTYISLPDREKAYFSSFVNANIEDREKIKNMTPDRVSDLYNTIWTRKDIMDKAIANGATAEQANQEVQKRIQKEDSYLAEEYNEEYKKWMNSKEAEKSSFREHLADIEAEEYIERTTGMPEEDFSGWDPRIDMKKIKLRALTIGGEDFFKFGFWKGDVVDLQRSSYINEDSNIKNISENMKKQIEEEIMVQDRIDKALTDQGYKTRRITTSTGDGSININMETLNE